MLKQSAPAQERSRSASVSQFMCFAVSTGGTKNFSVSFCLFNTSAFLRRVHVGMLLPLTAKTSASFLGVQEKKQSNGVSSYACCNCKHKRIILRCTKRETVQRCVLLRMLLFCSRFLPFMDLWTGLNTKKGEQGCRR